MALVSFETSSQIVVKMKKEGGVFTLPCTVNGLPLRFIFDTGASDVTLSLTEAKFMFKNGILKKEDILWTQKYQTASGDIQEGVNVVLRKVDINGIRLHNVIASIVLANNAPLLLGQSVLGRVGKFQVDSHNSTLTIFPNKGNTTVNTVTDVDGNVYNTISIDKQTWMIENLKVTKFNNGESIGHIKNNQDWISSISSAYCFYNNDTKQQAIYGNLYNWFAIMDQRGICPFGWHVPSLEEFEILEKYMKNNNVTSGSLKSTTNWQQPNLNANGYMGFNVQPAGKRWFKTGLFEFSKKGSYFWTSSSADNDRSYYYAFSYDYPEARKFNFFRGDGFSCRCIKD